MTPLYLRIAGSVLFAIAALSVIAAVSAVRTFDRDASIRASQAHAQAKRLAKPGAVEVAADAALKR